MRICITRSSRNAYSETFIRDQIAGFKNWADVYTIHSGRLPEKKEDGTLLTSKFLWAMHKVVKVFLGRNNFFGNYAVKKYLKDNAIPSEDSEITGLSKVLYNKYYVDENVFPKKCYNV